MEAAIKAIENKELQLQREKMKKWNDRRRQAEQNGIEKFYKLKSLFKRSKA